MGLLKTVVKGVVVAKVVQVAARELSKPENQQRIRDGLSRLGKTAGTH